MLVGKNLFLLFIVFCQTSLYSFHSAFLGMVKNELEETLILYGPEMQEFRIGGKGEYKMMQPAMRFIEQPLRNSSPNPESQRFSPNTAQGEAQVRRGLGESHCRVHIMNLSEEYLGTFNYKFLIYLHDDTTRVIYKDQRIHDERIAPNGDTIRSKTWEEFRPTVSRFPIQVICTLRTPDERIIKEWRSEKLVSDSKVEQQFAVHVVFAGTNLEKSTFQVQCIERNQHFLLNGSYQTG